MNDYSVIIPIIELCKEHIEKLLSHIEKLSEKTDNKKVINYLLYSENNLYLYNIHDIEELDYLELSKEDEKIVEFVFEEYICSNELYLIKEIFDKLYFYFNYELEEEEISDILSNIIVDLESNLISIPYDIDELLKLLEN